MSARPAHGDERPDPGEVAAIAGGLRTAVNRLAHALREPAAHQGVTPTRLTALATLERCGAMRPGDLAARMQVTAASMSRLTEALEQGDWITRRPDVRDRRACLLDLTPHGRETLEELRRENASELATSITALCARDRAALAAALPVLAALADRHLDRATTPAAPAAEDDRRA